MLGPVHYPMPVPCPMQVPYPMQATIWTFQGCCTQQTGWLKPLSALQFWLKIKVNGNDMLLLCSLAQCHIASVVLHCITACMHVCKRVRSVLPVMRRNTKRLHCTDSMTLLSGSASFFCTQCAACAAEEVFCLMGMLLLQGKSLNKLQA